MKKTPAKPTRDSKEREGACMPGKGGLCTVCGTGDCLRRPA